jgi:hypothetical protein
MKIALCLVVVSWGCVAGLVKADAPNTLTEKEKQDGFALLFSGEDLCGWEPTMRFQKPSDGPWKVRDGAIYFPAGLGLPSLAYCHRAIPADCEFRFEWRVAPTNRTSLQGHFAIATSGAMTQDGWTGSLFCDYFAGERSIRFVSRRIDVPIMFAGISRSVAPSKDVERPKGQWNEARIVHKGSLVQHWLNGEKIVELDLRQDDWLKVKAAPGTPLLDQWFKLKAEGLRLQIGSSDVDSWYRGLKLRAITKDEDIRKGRPKEARNADRHADRGGKLGKSRWCERRSARGRRIRRSGRAYRIRRRIP